MHCLKISVFDMGSIKQQIVVILIFLLIIIFASHLNQGGVALDQVFAKQICFLICGEHCFFSDFISAAQQCILIMLFCLIFYLDCCILLFWMLHSQMYLFIYLFVNNLVALSFPLVWSITVHL